MSSKRELLCPTLDIDLIWHTHQLLRRYTGDVVYNVGRYVDHDDKIEEGVLSDAFENTAKRWKARFNQNYSECGCLHNKPKTRHLLAQALSKNDGTSILSRIRAASEKPGDLDENSFDDSTHPSTHNGVAVRGSEWDAKRRNRKHRSDEQIKRGTRREGHVDPFIAGYGYMGLYPFVYVPPVAWVDGGVNGAVGSCVAASCGELQFRRTSESKKKQVKEEQTKACSAHSRSFTHSLQALLAVLLQQEPVPQEALLAVCLVVGLREEDAVSSSKVDSQALSQAQRVPGLLTFLIFFFNFCALLKSV